jgi:hypothetical protein
MQIMKWNRLFVLPLWLFLVSQVSFALEICNISPGSRAKNITHLCSKGQTQVSLLPLQDTDIDTDETYHLRFKPSLFNSERVIHILDNEDESEVLTIEVSDDQHVTFESQDDEVNWVFSGLSEADIKKLHITVKGNLFILDSIKVGQSLQIESDHLYLTDVFDILNGTFRLKYKKGFIPRILSSFQSRSEAEYSIIKSIGNISNPSRRRIQLSSIEDKESITVSVKDFKDAYLSAFEKSLPEAYPNFPALETEAKQREYIIRNIVPRISDNKKKGAIGEFLYQQYMKSQYPNYVFHDPKIGPNSFDAIYIRNQVEQGESKVKDIFISEVKYAAHGKPVLGVIKLANQEWRQLSNTYVNHNLKRMAESSTPQTVALAKTVTDHKDVVQLKLAVFNPHTFELTIYDIGDMKSSLFN